MIKTVGYCIKNDDELKEIIWGRQVVLYGAGEWSETICLYLDRFDCSVRALCVSRGQSVHASFETKLEVKYITAIDKEIEPVILIALSEKWWDEVYRELIKSGFEEVYTFSPLYYHKKIEKDRDVKRRRLWNSVVYNCVYDTTYDERVYEKKYEELKEKYSKVVLRFGYGRTIGGLLLELFYHLNYDEESNNYYVYQIINQEPALTRSFREPNEEAVNRYRGKNFEMINATSIGFWKYILKVHPDYIMVDTDYDYDNDIMRVAIQRMHSFSISNAKTQGILYDSISVEHGEHELQQMGIWRSFGCVFSRDSGYYRSTWSKRDVHIKTMESYRDSELLSFSEAIKVFEEAGYQSVRVGKFSGFKSKVAGLVDYASEYHNDFMDMYLAHRCSFYFGDHSGVLLFQAFKDKPVAITNYPLITSFDDGIFPFVRERDLIIYHKFFDPVKGRFLDLSEILEIEDCSEEDYTYSGSVKVFEKYKEKGIIPISNTKEEIQELAEELMSRMNGTIKYTKEDEELQQRYWNILLPYVMDRPKVFWVEARVGRSFLRNNLWLTQ